MGYLTWFLVTALIQMKKSKQNKKKLKKVVYCLKRKRVLKNVRLVPIPVLKEMRNLNKGIMLNGI